MAFGWVKPIPIKTSGHGGIDLPNQQIDEEKESSYSSELPLGAQLRIKVGACKVLIVAVSHDAESLNRRMHSLQDAGHVVVTASSLKSCLSVIAFNNYDLLLIGATIPFAERKAIVSESRKIRPESKIVSVERAGLESPVGADQVVSAGDENQLLATVAFIARKTA